MSAAIRSRTADRADAACAAAVDLARQAAVETAGAGRVGDHLGVEVEGERLVTHYFDCLETAYRGWRWAITVGRASRAKAVTINETCLLPGAGALLAPDWVPWSERLLPGDLGAGDLLPTAPDDQRLVPGYTGADEELELTVRELPRGGPDHEAVPFVGFEYGLGRVRVLSPQGRAEAAERWYYGEQGPTAPVAQAAPATCVSCGFLQPLGGAMGRAFGVCTNEYSPSDAKVVSFEYGCGAHSEGGAVSAVSEPLEPVIDEFQYDDVDLSTVPAEAETSAAEPVSG